MCGSLGFYRCMVARLESTPTGFGAVSVCGSLGFHWCVVARLESAPTGFGAASVCGSLGFCRCVVARLESAPTGSCAVSVCGRRSFHWCVFARLQSTPTGFGAAFSFPYGDYRRNSAEDKHTEKCPQRPGNRFIPRRPVLCAQRRIHAEIFERVPT